MRRGGRPCARPRRASLHRGRPPDELGRGVPGRVLRRAPLRVRRPARRHRPHLPRRAPPAQRLLRGDRGGGAVSRAPARADSRPAAPRRPSARGALEAHTLLPAPRGREAVSAYRHDLEVALSQRKALDETGHRPWPIPHPPWIMGQTWERLLFAHWRVPAERLHEVVHPEIPIDTFDGSAWIGVTPFTVTGFHVRGVPPPPLAGSFHEINVRTYATIGGKPGIYFLSLDAASKAAVHAARTGYRVPYFHADIDTEQLGDGRIRYRSERKDDPPAAFEAEYGPTSE